LTSRRAQAAERGRQQEEESRRKFNAWVSVPQNILGRRVSLDGFKEGRWQVFIDALPTGEDSRGSLVANAVEAAADGRTEVEARRLLEALPCALLTAPVSEEDARYIAAKLETLGARTSVRAV
jgi:hypothetical protein